MCAEAVSIGEQLVREYPQSAALRRDFSNSLDSYNYWRLNLSPQEPTIQDVTAVNQQALKLRQEVLADLEAGNPKAREPRRPAGSEASMVGPSLLWMKWDIAYSSHRTASFYRRFKDWRNAVEWDTRAIAILSELVEHNPSVASFDDRLRDAFAWRIEAATNMVDRKLVDSYSKDMVDFWKRMIELHPDVPGLRNYHEEAVKISAETSRRMATRPSTQPQ